MLHARWCRITHLCSLWIFRRFLFVSLWGWSLILPHFCISTWRVCLLSFLAWYTFRADWCCRSINLKVLSCALHLLLQHKHIPQHFPQVQRFLIKMHLADLFPQGAFVCITYIADGGIGFRHRLWVWLSLCVQRATQALVYLVVLTRQDENPALFCFRVCRRRLPVI